jgi:hypothetical protein
MYIFCFLSCIILRWEEYTVLIRGRLAWLTIALQKFLLYDYKKGCTWLAAASDKVYQLLVHSQLFDFWCLSATFNNISAISWRPVLVVEEAGSTRREPLTTGKQLVNFITYGCESISALLWIFAVSLVSPIRVHVCLGRNE